MKSPFSSWVAAHTFTPTELERYLSCPFGFYLETIQGLKALPEKEIEMTPAEQGDCLHRILAKFHGRERDSSNLTGWADEILQQFSKERPGLSPILFELKRHSILAALEAFGDCEQDRQKLSDGGWKIATTEWSFGAEAVPALQLPGPIRVRGRVDRIDVNHRERQFLVIDYKTGSTNVSGAAIQRGESFQLPLYLLAVSEFLFPDYEPVGALCYNLREMRLRDGIVHRDRLPEGFEISPRSSTLVLPKQWDSLFENTCRKVCEVVQSIEEGQFPPAPTPCRPRCPFRDVCRLASTQGEETKPEGDQ